MIVVLLAIVGSALYAVTARRRPTRSRVGGRPAGGFVRSDRPDRPRS